MSGVLKRNNIVAGGFLVGGMALAVGIAFFLGDFMEKLESTTSYVVSFSVDRGVTGIERGSQVTLGGLKVGRVQGVAFDTSGEAIEQVMVTIAVRSGVTLFQGARAEVVAPVLGGMSSLNIVDIGGSGGGEGDASPRVRLAEGGAFTGIGTRGLIEDAVGDLDVVALQEAVLAAIADGRTTLANVNEITGAFAPEAEPAAQNVAVTLEELRGFSEGLNEWRAATQPRVNAIIGDVGEFSGRLEGFASSADGIFENAGGFLTDVRGFFDKNEPRISDTIDEANAFVAQVNDVLTPQASELLQAGTSTLQDAGQVVGDASLLLDEQAPGLRRTLANVRLVSDRATIFFEEIAAAPWRVLQRPGDKQLREEVVYNAARQYADAVARLRDASASLDAVLGGLDGEGPSAGLDAQQILVMRRELEEAFERYADTERTLLERLSGGATD